MSRLAPRRLLALLYAAALVGWLAVRLCLFAWDRSQPEITLPISEATLNEMAPAEEGEGWQNQPPTGPSPDPYILFDTGGAGLRRVFLPGSFNQNPGELDFYYAKNGNGFSPKHRVWARPVPGGYEYHLPPGHYTALRLDTGTSEQNILYAEALVLNPRQPLWQTILPTGRQALALTALPALAAALLATLYRIVQTVQTTKKRDLRPKQ